MCTEWQIYCLVMLAHHFKNELRYNTKMCAVNTLRPEQNGCHFADDIFKCISLKENFGTWIKISLECVAYCTIGNKSTLVTGSGNGLVLKLEPMTAQSTDMYMHYHSPLLLTDIR